MFRLVQLFLTVDTFLKAVLDASSQLAFGNAVSPTESSESDNSLSPSKPTLTRSLSELSQTRLSKTSSCEYNPTFSVRGATLARPEGYCLCLDTPFSPEQRLKQRLLAKALLPRLVMSTRKKCPLLHRFTAVDADEDEGQHHPSVHNPHAESNGRKQQHFPWEKRQRAIQFLNSDQSQAVKLITPPFDCGAVRAPITIFIIAAATEDGCFLSGRKSRFEFGHMYPLSNRDMMIDMSPICIATEPVGCEGQSLQPSRCNNHATDDDSGSSDEGDSSSCSDESLHCSCKFDSADPFHPKNTSIEGK